MPEEVPETAPEAAEAPKSLLEQMEELLAAVSADLSQLDANLQTAGTAHENEPVPVLADEEHHR